MFGQAFPLGAADFWAGVGVVVDGVELVGAVDVVLAAPVDAVLCVVVGDAAALAMPAAAPAVAIAPATIVAPSILEMVIGSNLLGLIDGMCGAIVRDRAKPQRRRA
jgi:hypothetical protein